MYFDLHTPVLIHFRLLLVIVPNLCRLLLLNDLMFVVSAVPPNEKTEKDERNEPSSQILQAPPYSTCPHLQKINDTVHLGSNQETLIGATISQLWLSHFLVNI